MRRFPGFKPLPVLLACGLVALVVGLATTAGQAHAATPSLFGTKEIHSSNLTLFPKWRGVMDRFDEEKIGCGDPLCNKPYWENLLKEMAGADRMTQIERINREMNERLYIIDPINWGVPDYWATPFQFLRKNGDCEDYAIAKFMALRALGFENPEMRIVVLNDLNLGIAHAILVVYVDGRALVLDNQISSVVRADSIRHYQPVYSVNEEGWWLHRPQ
mgnify:CR=1 FL=1